MSFWPLGRRRKEPEPAPSAPPKPDAVRLSVAEFWTAERRLSVGMDLSQGRLTDMINGDDSVRVVLLDVVPEDPSQQLEMRPDQQWTDLGIEEALLVFPPPQTTDPRRRLHRPKQPIDIRIGPFTILGSVHIPPGAQAAGFLFRLNTRFTPITRAAVQDTRLAGFEQRADVVLVNLKRVDVIRDVGLDEKADDEGEEMEALRPPESAEEPDEPDPTPGA